MFAPVRCDREFSSPSLVRRVRLSRSTHCDARARYLARLLSAKPVVGWVGSAATDGGGASTWSSSRARSLPFFEAFLVFLLEVISAAIASSAISLSFMSHLPLISWAIALTRTRSAVCSSSYEGALNDRESACRVSSRASVESSHASCLRLTGREGPGVHIGTTE